MAETETTVSETPTGASKSPVKMVIRVVLAVVLLVVLVLAVIDFRAKGQAKDTADAWMQMMDDDTEVYSEDAIQGGVVGDPTVEVQEGAEFGVTAYDYTWPGTLRSYRVRLSLRELATDTIHIQGVDGPYNE